MMSLITLPDTTTMLTALHDPAQGIFTDLLPIIYFLLGLFIGGFLLRKVTEAVQNTLHNMFYEHDEDRRWVGGSDGGWEIKR